MNNQKEEKNNGVSCFLEVKCFNQELLGVFFWNIRTPIAWNPSPFAFPK